MVRGLSLNIAIFFATLIAGFLLYLALEPAGSALLDVAATNTETEAAADGQQYVAYAWQNLHILVIAIGALQLLAAAVAQQRGVGIQ